MKIWEYIKADSLFRGYLPEIKNHKHKIRGKNTKGNPLDFTDAEKAAIMKAIKKMVDESSL